MTILHRSCVLALCLALMGCGGVNFLGGDYASLLEVVERNWNARSTSITRDMAAGVPYASLGFRVGGGGQGMLLLVGGSTDPLLWAAGRKFAIVTNKGRVVRTKGFGYDLGGYQLARSVTRGDGVVERHWLADFPDLEKYSVPVVCTERAVGEETITILEQPLRTKKMAEECASEETGFSWSYQNTYWVGREDGFVWRSLQHVHPKLPAVEIEIFRPPFRN
jgi:hypothetical protein